MLKQPKNDQFRCNNPSRSQKFCHLAELIQGETEYIQNGVDQEYALNSKEIVHGYYPKKLGCIRPEKVVEALNKFDEVIKKKI